MDHETARVARLSERMMDALRTPLDAALTVIANEPSVLRDVAAYLTGYALAAEQRAAEIDAIRRRTPAEHRAAMERKTR